MRINFLRKQNQSPSRYPTAPLPAACARVFSIFVLLVGFGLSFARAERLPDAAQAATHLGQDAIAQNSPINSRPRA
jgi:hypothetical protein